MHLRISSIIILLFVLGFYVQKVESQVVISPEVGVSYMPVGNHPIVIDTEKNVNFIFGLSGRVQFTTRSFMSTSISYANRGNLTTLRPIFLQVECARIFDVLKHSDLNIDLTYQRKFFDKLIIGIGGSLIYKLNTTHCVYCNYVSADNYIGSTSLTEWWKGVNLNLIYQLNPVEIKFRYSYFIDTGDYLDNPTDGIRMPNRFDLMVSYPLEFGRKNSRRQ